MGITKQQEKTRNPQHTANTTNNKQQTTNESIRQVKELSLYDACILIEVYYTLGSASNAAFHIDTSATYVEEVNNACMMVGNTKIKLLQQEKLDAHKFKLMPFFETAQNGLY